MNQLCKVCGEPAAGFHFGAFTCEGCKSFFGRTYNNISAIAGCKNNGDCVINKKNRTACKACRLRKCLLVGMSKSGSRYGRRSNWFKIHCLLQEQQGSGATSIGSSGNALSSSNLEQLARLQQASNQARQTYQDKTNPCIKSAAAAAHSPTYALQQAAAAAAAAAAVASATSTTSTTTSTALSSSSPTTHTLNHLPNFLQAAKFLNGQHHHHHHHHQQQHHSQQQQVKNDSRFSNTPSDSGASSAGDPADDSTSITTMSVRQRNCNSVQPTLDSLHDINSTSLEHERRRKELLEIFRSHSEPLRTAFAPFALPPSLLACTPPTHMLPLPAAAAAAAASASATSFYNKHREESTATPTSPTERCNTTVQDEPIDLSFKSTRQFSSRSPTPNTSPRSSPAGTRCRDNSPPANAAAILAVRKTTPLDLTLVRSTQTLTG